MNDSQALVELLLPERDRENKVQEKKKKKKDE